MATTLRSYAKINLGLAIGPKRPDGFHDLLTLYQTVAAHDLVTVSARRLPASATRSRLSLTSNNPRVPCDARNTAWRMVTGALDILHFAAEVHIHIEKALPIQGGLGAGSANAATALLALEGELGQIVPDESRLKLAADVGSDVPLFLLGGTVLGSGRGEVVEPLPDLPEAHCVIGIPDGGVSTPRAFEAWDVLERSRDELTSSRDQGTFRRLGRLYDSVRSDPNFALLEQGDFYRGLSNDFEEAVFPLFPLLADIKGCFSGKSFVQQPTYCSLSGSGSALFGLYRTLEAAGAAITRLQSMKVQYLLTRTLPREAYWAEMGDQGTGSR